MTPAEIKFRNYMTVKLRNSMAKDADVVEAAKVSTTDYDPDAYDTGNKAGLITYLMKNRHGTPFEHNAFKFYIECPIFVAREFMRHRMASYNEESGRYKQLKPVFWVPSPARGLIQTGKPGAYVMKPGTVEQFTGTVAEMREHATVSYRRYERLLDEGICREVARGVLPVSIYTSFYVTVNARGLMNFLSLRIDSPDATYPSKPQYEIEQVASQMEVLFQSKMPLTYKAFTDNGRVAP
jgi:thymidylate synthase (FAD)